MATLLSSASNYRGAGIHQYSANLLQYLPRQAPQFQYHAFVMDRAYNAPAGMQLTRPRWLSPSPGQRILWEQTQVGKSARQLDLLHGLAYALPIWGNTPSIVTVHDLTFMLFPQAFPSYRRRYLTWMTRNSCQRARAVITDSAATAQDVQRLLAVPEEKIHVVYTGIDERFRPLPREEVEAYRRQRGWPQQFILMLGTLEPRKNHILLIQAYQRYLHQARTPLPLLIGGGEGWQFQQIFQSVDAAGLEKDVKFLGFVPWEDMPWLYNAATLFIYPSRYEGFGLPVAEAMRCGTPVITSNVSSLPEVAGNAALTIDPNDPETLAAAMLLLLEKEPERQQIMREAGLIQAAKFSWQNTASQTAQVYARVLQEAYG